MSSNQSGRGRWLVALTLAVPLCVLAWWLASPLFVDRVADEAFPFSEKAAVPDYMTRAEVEATMAEAAATERPVAEEMPAMSAVVVLKSGEFRDADSFHRGSGRATIYSHQGRESVLRLEDFRVTNGPDLRVLLSRHPDPASHDDLSEAGYVELGKLKGNVGDQNYEIPPGTDVEGQASVVIFCRPFRVVFSVASLGDAEG